ncbi:MAG: YitT family protein [Oscillospiraceae bacterium]|nr:YitT family protein [Oscillospiraceae bacterium]
MKLQKTIKEFAYITVGTAIIAASVFFFMQPFHLSLGSVAGLAIVLEDLLGLKVSVITMIINVVLLLFGFLLIGREFGAKTIYTSILLPVMLGILEQVFPENVSLTGDAFIDMVCHLFVVSLGQSILFGQNASSGGLDIVAKIMNKFLRMDLGKAISLTGMCIAFSSALVFDKKTVVISVLGTYLNGMVLDHFIFGSNIKRRVCIISNHREEILDYVLNTLHSGATLYEAKGAYSNAVSTEVIVIVDKNEYRLLMNYIAKTDPKAFVTVYNVNEVVYQPKRTV